MRGLTRWLSRIGRLGLALTFALLVLAVTRWWPIGAETPFDVRALPLAAPALGFAILAALTGRERVERRWIPAALAWILAAAALATAVAVRGPAGLAGEVEGPSGPVGTTRAGPIDITGRDLDFTTPRRVSLRWRGELRPPVSGAYRLSVEGRGRVVVSLAGHTVLEAQGEEFRAAKRIGLSRGPLTLDVHLEQTGPGLRLRLGWTRPDGRSEPIPARSLGPRRSEWVWRLTDALAVAVAALAGLAAWMAPWDRPRRLAARSPLRWPEAGLASLGYLGLLVVMSWPLVRDMIHTGPMDRPDGRLNAWILAWVGQTVWTAPRHLFQAPAFHPLPDALAFSENLLLPGALVAPVQPLLGPVFAYDLVLLGSLLLSGLGTYLLVRRVSDDRLAAFVAGAYFAAGPHRWTRLAHLHAQMTVFLPLSLLALDLFWRRRTLRRALLVGLTLALQGLASIYLGAITAAALGVAVGVALFAGLKPIELGRLALGFLLAGAILWPAVGPYLRMREFQAQEFTLDTVSIYAASLPSYAAAGTAAWGWLSQRLLDPAAVRDTLFPGLTVLGLGLVGLASAPRRYRAVAVAASLVAVLFSLGPETAFYRFLHEHLVLVRGVRALSRFALIPTLALSVLAGLALSERRRVFPFVALALMMVESANLPLRLGRYDGPSSAARWLAGKPGAVLVLPLAVDDTRAMLDGLVHSRPLVNGDSGFIPRPFDRAMELFAYGVDAEGLRFLRAVDVRHVVSPGPVGLPEVAAFGPTRVNAIPPGESARVVPPGAPAATRWTPDGVILTLDGLQPVDRVAFVLSDAEWVASPNVAASSDGLSWRTIPATASLADATLSLYRDPRNGRGEVRFAPVAERFLRVDPQLPARPGLLEVGP